MTTPADTTEDIIAVTHADGTGEVRIDDELYTIKAPSLTQARSEVRHRVAAVAAERRRPLLTHTSGPDGNWNILIHPDGRVTDPDAADPSTDDEAPRDAPLHAPFPAEVDTSAPLSFVDAPGPPLTYAPEPPTQSDPAPGLNLADVRLREKLPSGKWYRRLFGLGPSAAERAYNRRTTRVRQPLHGRTFVAMTCQIKGGDGKTTDAILTAQALAETTGHQVVVVSADPANGNLLERLFDFPTEADLLAHPTGIDLYRAEKRARAAGAVGLTDAHEINRYLLLAGRLRACGARQIIEDRSDDQQDTGLTAEQLTVLIECLSRVADIIIIDCGTGTSTAAFKTALSRADGVALIGNPRWDVLSKANQSLKFMQSRRSDILAKSVLALNSTDNGGAPTTFDLHKTLAQFMSQIPAGRVDVPYDPHIANGTAIVWDQLEEATRDAALDLAGAMADLFPVDSRDNTPRRIPYAYD